MCGIVGITAQRDIARDLITGLKALEYRGYDSAGIAVLDASGQLQRLRTKGKVNELRDAHDSAPRPGHTGIAHTRWATHGPPSEGNAHPHVSGDQLSVVHNGIIENHASLRQELETEGFVFTSQTDTEVIAHLIERAQRRGMSLLDAVIDSAKRLHGAYAIVAMSAREPDTLVGTRRGSPLVLGVGEGENYLASDIHALLPLTRRFIYLQEGDVARIDRQGYTLLDEHGGAVEREAKLSNFNLDAVERGQYRHYMLKEIHEQPQAVADTLEGRIGNTGLLPGIFGPGAEQVLADVRGVQIVACGTSYHAGLVARYWIESMAGIPCQVEIASEFRYRQPVVPAQTLFLTISQSGETADTLAALRMARGMAYAASLAVCNVPESSLVRESDHVLMTRAGPEIGVASTKAFSTQLAALALLAIELGRTRKMSAEQVASAIDELKAIPGLIAEALDLDDQLQDMAEGFVDKDHALFLGRGTQYPIALEGALKLKEISYIHAEGYPAGELKHGPLALVDADMPVVAVAPNDSLLDKLRSNMEEVRARGGILYLFVDHAIRKDMGEGRVLELPSCGELAAPIVFNVPLQLLAYHVAVQRGTDVDQPRNLAKSVTVE